MYLYSKCIQEFFPYFHSSRILNACVYVQVSGELEWLCDVADFHSSL